MKTTILNNFALFFFTLSILLSSCTYKNNSIILLLPDEDQASSDQQRIESQKNPNLFLGNISNLDMNSNDRSRLNHLFEKTVSFQEAHWHNSKINKNYIIVLRPAYHNYTINLVCRPAEFFLQGGNTNEKHSIIGCRKQNGQWFLLKEQLKN